MSVAASGKVGKGLIRSLVKRGSKDVRRLGHAREEARGQTKEGSVCDHCGAVYMRRSWRKVARTPPPRPLWTVCPACKEVTREEWHGRILMHGIDTPSERSTIERRIHNVAERAAHTQPERKLVSLQWNAQDLEVLTTSQRLGHRIARELVKLLGGSARYQWDDNDGSLFAVWERPDNRHA